MIIQQKYIYLYQVRKVNQFFIEMSVNSFNTNYIKKLNETFSGFESWPPDSKLSSTLRIIKFRTQINYKRSDKYYLVQISTPISNIINYFMLQFRSPRSLTDSIKFGTQTPRKLRETLNSSCVSNGHLQDESIVNSTTPNLFGKKNTQRIYTYKNSQNEGISSSKSSNFNSMLSYKKVIPKYFEETTLINNPQNNAENNNPNVNVESEIHKYKVDINMKNEKNLTKSCKLPQQVDLVQEMQMQLRNLKSKLVDSNRRRDDLEKKLQQCTQQLQKIKEINRDQSKKIVQSTNTMNQLQADLFVATSKLKQQDSSVVQSSYKESDLKQLIIMLSQQKNQMSNKISELLLEKAKRQNKDTFEKIQKTNHDSELQNVRIQQLQEINSLKKRINQLQNQQNVNQMEYYKQRVRLLESQIKHLLVKCVSQQTKGHSRQRSCNLGGDINDVMKLQIPNERADSSNVFENL